MTEIAALERRITAALERIGQGVDALGSTVAPPPAPLPAPEDDPRLEELVDRLDRATRQIDAQTQEMARMQETITVLQSSLQALRDAPGGADPQLLNSALVAELDALRAARSAETAELDAILAELKPLITEVRHA